MLVYRQLGLGLSWVVCLSADMQRAFGVTSDVFFPGCHWQGQESSVNIYPSQFAAFRNDESPAALGTSRGGEERRRLGHM